MNERLKKIVFRKLYEDLSHVEIIQYGNSIWFIDRQKKYWYFEYSRIGLLWWRFEFFSSFFDIFGIERKEYELIMSEWMEEVLNKGINATYPQKHTRFILSKVEDMLKDKPNRAEPNLIIEPKLWFENQTRMEDLLKHKIGLTMEYGNANEDKVERVLNHKVISILPTQMPLEVEVQEALYQKGVGE